MPPYGDAFARSNSIHMDPLEVAGRLSERVDTLLDHRDPVGHADLLTDGGAHVARFFEADGLFFIYGCSSAVCSRGALLPVRFSRMRCVY